MKYDEPKAPEAYRCNVCGAHGVKLWRWYQTFLDQQELFCAACGCARENKVDNFDEQGWRRSEDGFRTDQIGWLVPAVPTEDESTYWGYSSVPEPGVVWWRQLPTRSPSS